MQESNVWIALIVTAVLVAVNGMLASSEIAMMGLSALKLRQSAQAGDKKAQLLLRMKEQPGDFLSTVQIGITLAGLLSGAFAADTLAGPLISWMAALGMQGSALRIAGGAATFLITLLMTFFMLVFGELVPKRVAMARPEATARGVIGPITVLSRVTRPLVRLLAATTNGVLRLIGIGPDQQGSPVTEDDVLLLMQEGHGQGAIEQNELEFVANVFEFTDLTAQDAMTHRTEIHALSADDSITDLLGLMRKTGYNKFLVVGRSMDDVLGVVYSKDLVSHYATESAARLRVGDVMRPAYFIPRSKRLVTLFGEMKQGGERLAVVVDEYGGTAGIITLMDIIEQVVGDLDDPGRTVVSQLSEHEYRCNGLADMADIADFFGLHEDADAHDTLSGFLIARLGYVPGPGARPGLDIGGYHFQVEEAAGGAIRSVLVTRQAEPS